MRLTIVAVDRIGRSAEAELFARYEKRLAWPLEVHEVEVKGQFTPAEKQRREGEKLLSYIKPGNHVVALDERGKTFTSMKFSAHLQDLAARGLSNVTFLIGGADGHGDAVRDRANLLLSFGNMTWPHLLARAMLVEQLYRAHMIAQGHPYHREG